MAMLASGARLGTLQEVWEEGGLRGILAWGVALGTTTALGGWLAPMLVPPLPPLLLEGALEHGHGFAATAGALALGVLLVGSMWHSGPRAWLGVLSPEHVHE